MIINELVNLIANKNTTGTLEAGWNRLSNKYDENPTPNLDKSTLNKENTGKILELIRNSLQKISDTNGEVNKIKDDYAKLQQRQKEEESKLTEKDREIQTHIAKIKELSETNTKDISALQEVIKQKDHIINQQQERIKDLESRIKNLQPVKKPSQWDTTTQLYFVENRDNNGKRE